MLFLLLGFVSAQWFYHEDVLSYHNYRWAELVKPSSDPYRFKVGDTEVVFNIGANLQRSCGPPAAAIKKTSDKCLTVGHHEDSMYHIIDHPKLNTSGIAIRYRGSSRCTIKNSLDAFHTITFKLLCSSLETDFTLQSTVDGCHLVFEKQGQVGCLKPKQWGPLEWCLML